MTIHGPSNIPGAKHEAGEGVENEEKPKRKILIVEDEEVLAKVLEEKFKNENFSVATIILSCFISILFDDALLNK